MAEALISAVLEQLVSFSCQQTGQEARLLLGVDKEIKSLETKFKILKGLIVDAEEKQITSEGVKAWLEDVKDIAYRTEDVLDEWHTKFLQGTTTITESSINTKKKKQVLSCLPCSFFCFKRVVERHEIGNRIIDIKRQLDENVRHIDLLELITKLPIHRQENLHSERHTTSFVDVSEIYGREDSKDTIVGWLLNESSQIPQVHVPIISIIGTGGFGKTTLTQLVYNQENVKTAFEPMIWVCISELVDLQSVAKEILEQITGKRPEVDGLQTMLRCLCDNIQGKRFLLVLDDVWPKNLMSWWSQLQIPLDKGAPGSNIIVTTRDQSVVDTMGSNHTLSLEPLPYKYCWLLFQQIAFSRKLPEECQKFEATGVNIVKKCKGIPLAVKAIASLLMLKTTQREWQSVLNSDVWGYVEEKLSPALLLSYHDLPSYLKQCLIYCAVIPKDTVMKKERLIKLWMAQGFLGSDEGKELEMVGEAYFNELAMRSFFQDFKKNDIGSVDSCKMHDLVHDFAQSLTRTECCVIQTNDGETSSTKVRHLAVLDIENPSISKVKKNLRTLIVSYSLEDFKDLSKWFHELTCLRTLDLSGSKLKELPKEVEFLLHLRYLDVSRTELTELPETLCKLCNLQTLKLNDCGRFYKLGDRIGELTNLRHLEIELAYSLEYFPKGTEKLRRLRTLSKFVVGCETGGCKIGELGNLIHLGGFLSIEGLWQVDNMMEARQARLHEKKNLDTLVLDFRRGREYTSAEDRDKMEGVLKGLQPHDNLKRLNILYYPGKTVNLEIVPDLSHLSLVGCRNIKTLPALSELQSLESLEIKGVNEMKHVSAELLKISGIGVHGESTSSSVPTSLKLFPKLKTLSLYNISKWDENFEEETINKTIMPCLHSLVIDGCPKLKVLPHYMFSQTLRELSIWNCPGLSGMQPCLPPLLEKLFLGGNVGVLSKSLMPNNNSNSYPNLKCVTIGKTQISSLPQGISQFMSLQKLELKFCKFLDFKPEEEFRHLHTLPTLTIYIKNCPLLKERSGRENWSNLSNFPKIIFDDHSNESFWTRLKVHKEDPVRNQK